MGAYRHISLRRDLAGPRAGSAMAWLPTPWAGTRTLALVFLILVGLALSSAARAEDDPAPRDVSASTEAVASSPGSTPTAAPERNAVGKRPLTRAAEQEWVEAISPVAWLGRFGDVTIGRSK